MPLYEYRCTSCGRITEVLKPAEQRDEPVACRWCGQQAFRKVSSFAAAGGNGGGCGPCTSKSCAGCR